MVLGSAVPIADSTPWSVRLVLAAATGIAAANVDCHTILALLVLVAVCGFVGAEAPSLDFVQFVLIGAVVYSGARTMTASGWIVGTCLVGLMLLYVVPAVRFGGWTVVDLVVPPVITALAVGAGLESRKLAAINRQMRELQDIERRHAVSEEQRRIVAEVHDVAAHHLSALVVRAKVALRIDTYDDLEDATRFAATTASSALDSLRQLAVSERLHASAASLGPQQGLDNLDDVISFVGKAGLVVAVVRPDVLPPLGTQTDLAALRIVQESLSNVLRHRGPGPARLGISTDGHVLRIVVDDDGQSNERRSSSFSAAGSGLGLISMTERAMACGGTLDAGRTARGGWHVIAELPINE